MEKIKDNREKVYRFRANDEESELIEKKYTLSSCKSMSDFFRQMILYGIVVKYDESNFKKTYDLFKKISNNFNQIAVRANATSRVYTEDIERIAKEIDEIWLLLNTIQSELQKLKP